MEVFRNASQAGRWAPYSVAAIGKFDGLHLGHQQVIRLAVERAAALKTKSLVVTFDPLPQQLFHSNSFRPLLSVGRKLDLLREMRVDAALLLRFTHSFACQAPEVFAKQILVKQLRVMDVFVGENFCFGKNRAGRVDELTGLGRTLGFLVHPVPLVTMENERVSASRIHELIARKQFLKAQAFLGRHLDGLAALKSET